MLSLVVTGTAASVLTYVGAHRGVGQLLDAHLRQGARLLVAQAELELDELQLDEEEDDFSTEVAFQVCLSDRDVLLRSPNAPAEPFAGATRSFSDAVDGARRWRVFTLANEHGETIVHFAEDHATRELIARRMAVRARAGRRRAAATGPAGPVRRRPLDALLLRMRDSLDSERRFTSHAAHELRTPVAALRAQAEVASIAHDPAVREAALAHCIPACDRTSRLVSQLLLLARADELNALLEALVRNLIDNAVRHGRSDVHVAVRADHDGRTVFEVMDDGPGVPEDALMQLGHRFYRVAGSPGTGSGLGLSIVVRIAQLHGDTVRFEHGSQCRGLRARATFPG
jgi:two-component system sensor histidine kinase QseC